MKKNIKKVIKKPVIKKRKPTISKEKIQFYNTSNINFKIMCNLRNLINSILEKNYNFIQIPNLIGCSILELQKYLANQFISTMNWNNYGKSKDKWLINCINNYSNLNLKNEESLKKYFHYSNLKPMWNVIK